MCRLFGFRSIIPSQVHRSLVSAENALSNQSERHPDGWGVGHYVGGIPQVIRSAQTALEDRIFHKISGVVSSETVIAHLRKATQGELSPLNAHPFQFGRWTFAHNGNLKNFGELRETLLEEIRPNLRRYILGTTDSEVLFFFLLDRMASRHELHDPNYPADEAIRASRETVDEVASLCGGISIDPDLGADGTYLTFLLTNGSLFVAHQGGMPLLWSTWKRRCPERDTCPSFSRVCESPVREGRVHHLLLSSEELQGDNVWTPMLEGQIVTVDSGMRLRISQPESIGGGFI